MRARSQDWSPRSLKTLRLYEQSLQVSSQWGVCLPPTLCSPVIYHSAQSPVALEGALKCLASASRWASAENGYWGKNKRKTGTCSEAPSANWLVDLRYLQWGHSGGLLSFLSHLPLLLPAFCCFHVVAISIVNQVFRAPLN